MVMNTNKINNGEFTPPETVEMVEIKPEENTEEKTKETFLQKLKNIFKNHKEELTKY